MRRTTTTTTATPVVAAISEEDIRGALRTEAGGRRESKRHLF